MVTKSLSMVLGTQLPAGHALALGKFGYFIGGILGVISSAVKEVADIVGFKNFEDTLILLVAQA